MSNRALDPLRALVVDDEPLARDAVRRVLASRSDVTVVGDCGDGGEAVARIRRERPDLVLLDVQMPEAGGFEVCRQVGAADMPTVVFVTAHDRYALEAFRVHAVDYVLKPFDDDRLHEAVSRAVRRTRLENAEALSARLHALLDVVERPPPARSAEPIRRITVKTRHGVRYVPVEEIEWLESERNYVHIHASGDVHTIRATLTEVAGRLDPGQFVRVHRSRVVNLDRVAEVQPWYSGDYLAILKSGERLRVSRRYKDGLLRLTT